MSNIETKDNLHSTLKYLGIPSDIAFTNHFVSGHGFSSFFQNRLRIPNIILFRAFLDTYLIFETNS